MFDLALGFIIGTAFAALVDSLANDILLQFVAAIFGAPDFSQMSFTMNDAEIRYDSFINVLIRFLLLALVLFGIVKLLKRFGLGNFRAQGQQEFVAIDAIKCKYCTADIDPGQLEEEDIELLRKREGWQNLNDGIA